MAQAAPTTNTTAAATVTPAAPADNNVAATQAGNASFAAANPGVFSGSSTPPPPISNTIGSQQLSSTSPVQLPPPPPPTTGLNTANGMVAGASTNATSVAQYMQQLAPPTTALDQQQQGILNSIATLSGEDANKAQDTANAQAGAGIPGMQTAVQTATNAINSKTADYNQMQANLGGNGAPETSAVLAAQNAGLAKAKAADIGVLSAQLTAAQGNLSLAQQQVTDAINLKYSTIEGQITAQKAQLDALAPFLSQEQSTEAAAQKQVLQDQANAVADQKATETQINNVALSAAQAGASSDVIAAINNSPDVISAIAAAAPALGAAATQKLQQQQFDNNVTLQQLAISKANEGIAAENAATNKETADEKNTELLNETSPQALLQYAQQYQATGVMPQTAVTDGLSGAVNAIATGAGTKNGQPAIPLPVGTIINQSTGVADTKMSADQEQSINALYNIVNNVLPQLTQTYTAPYGGSISPADQQTLQSYLDTANDLKTALTSLGSAGILKGTTSTFENLIPNDSFWTKGLLNTSAGKRQIANLQSTLQGQLSSYLSTNNLNIVGFNDGTDTTGVNSNQSLSQFVTK